MKEPENEEIPVRSMPESHHQENDEQVNVKPPLYDFAFVFEGEWKIDIVSQPGGKRNVPPAPEFSNGLRTEWPVKIGTELEP